MKQKWPIWLVVALMLGGCAKNIVKTEHPELRHEIEERQAYFLWGLTPTHEYATDEFCQAGIIARVEQKMVFKNWLASFFTFGIYTPRTLEVTCARLPREQGGATSKSEEPS